MKRTRRKFSSKFKTKVVLEVLKEQQTIQELASKYEVHPNQISTWKNDFLSNASTVFDSKKEKQETIDDSAKLYKVIGEQKVEIDFLKEVLGK